MSSAHRRFSIYGMTLIEVIVSILIVIILFGTVYEALTLSVTTGLVVHRRDRAIELAQERMEVILADAASAGSAGFATLTDTCSASPPAYCPTIPDGFSVTTTLSDTYSGTSDMREVTVTVTPAGGLSDETLTTVVGKYS